MTRIPQTILQGRWSAHLLWITSICPFDWKDSRRLPKIQTRLTTKYYSRRNLQIVRWNKPKNISILPFQNSTRLFNRILKHSSSEFFNLSKLFPQFSSNWLQLKRRKWQPTKIFTNKTRILSYFETPRQNSPLGSRKKLRRKEKFLKWFLGKANLPQKPFQLNEFM